MHLFSSEKTHLQLPNAELLYIPNFYDASQADNHFNNLRNNVPWQQDYITLFGKTHPQPRLTALYATNKKPYSYSNITMLPHKFTQELQQVKADVERIAELQFTTVLLNFYRNGNDSNGWHADNEKSLGVNPMIASLSLGASRRFQFKHQTLKEQRHHLDLEHGSLLIMKGEMQHYWLHQISKTKKPVGERLNLTFRTL